MLPYMEMFPISQKNVENCKITSNRSFKFSISKGAGEHMFPQRDDEDFPPDNLSYRLLKLLHRLTRLESLHFNLPEFATDSFGEAFNDENLSLPGVKTVVVGSFNDFIIKHCPNVETVASNGWVFLYSKRGQSCELGKPKHAENFIISAGQASKLLHFEMSQSWQVEQLQGEFVRSTHLCSSAKVSDRAHRARCPSQHSKYQDPGNARQLLSRAL
jgi:hypothetical protein